MNSWMNRQADALGLECVPAFEEGFIDQHDNFLDRRQAMVIARAAGQIRRELHESEVLYSENLY